MIWIIVGVVLLVIVVVAVGCDCDPSGNAKPEIKEASDFTPYPSDEEHLANLKKYAFNRHAFTYALPPAGSVTCPKCGAESKDIRFEYFPEDDGCWGGRHELLRRTCRCGRTWDERPADFQLLTTEQISAKVEADNAWLKPAPVTVPTFAGADISIGPGESK